MKAETPAALQLTRTEVRTVRSIVHAVLGADARVRVFGSRATGRARPFSDLDLLFVQPACLSWQQRADLRDRFEASDLPFRVDLVDGEALAPGMAQRVVAESVWLAES